MDEQKLKEAVRESYKVKTCLALWSRMLELCGYEKECKEVKLMIDRTNVIEADLIAQLGELRAKRHRGFSGHV